ncbi:hypothetical protein C8R46DRAFT_1226531 [Mycena filopes]|nr:hypothetical protein C8R46DRAFT_1226531 [Mycena filopes]
MPWARPRQTPPQVCFAAYTFSAPITSFPKTTARARDPQERHWDGAWMSRKTDAETEEGAAIVTRGRRRPSVTHTSGEGPRLRTPIAALGDLERRAKGDV